MRKILSPSSKFVMNAPSVFRITGGLDLDPLTEVNSFCKGPNRVGVLLPSPEEGNRSSFQNTVFYRFFEFRMIHSSELR
jgi:hypothetical protein